MAGQDEPNKPHFFLQNNAQSEPFSRPPRTIATNAPTVRDRHAHGNLLLGQLQALAQTQANAKRVQQESGLVDGFGLQIEFQSFPEIELAFERLDRRGSGIELRNVRHEGDFTYAMVFVPEGQLDAFENLIASYLDETRDGRQPRNASLLNTIAAIRAATLNDLWTDDPALLPTSDNDTLWWEVWLPAGDDRQITIQRFSDAAIGLGFKLAESKLEFPERTVLMMFGSVGQMKRSVQVLNSIAELRRVKETADFFDSQPNEEQAEWLEELKNRLFFNFNGANTPHVCLFDMGVNNGHELLAPALADEDKHTVNPAWGKNDTDGHGTGLAGVALLGNLTPLLDNNQQIRIAHRLESVKLLPQNNANDHDPEHHGYLTIQAVASPEITAPQRQRVFSSSITAKGNRDRGRPSAWSATIDRLAADAENEAERPRLFILAAGNIEDNHAWDQYPDSNTTDSIHDPAQAWNALTIGACSHLVNITEPDTQGYQPVAPEGGLSPFSTTSQNWQAHWALKPDVVFEGGNVAKNELGAIGIPSLCLLTTGHQPDTRLFTTTNATSAASALAARMAAQLMAEYPNLWPETIRALMVHSARWTPAMKQMFLPGNGQPTKTQMAALVRHCGFGEPTLDRAMWSLENSLTMVCESRLRPYVREQNSEPKFRDMNLHRLPWPLPELEALGETDVEMRVTLSYFIEPNPSARGVKSRYRYESHCLRFDVKRPLESEEFFRARINAAARDEDGHTRARGSDNKWAIGTDNRHKGSLHSDIWTGSAAELASRGMVAVYPATGWWKTRKSLERYDLQVRYSLLISITAPDVEAKLYTAVANQIGTPVVVET
ncbi:S8 family peptidase [Salinisphaera aquimarina]|uniref:S8 family peptidase n=1 Tax=Salinisphaera aquimarina TaxID=2094031 RepID=A0ABV7EQJ1_9GAMM